LGGSPAPETSISTVSAAQPTSGSTQGTAPRRTNGAGIFGCSASGDKQTAGALVGGFLGGFLGNRIAGRGNRTFGTILGGALGAAGGSALGCKLQKDDQAKAEAALETALAKNESQSWQNAQSGASGSVQVSDAKPTTSLAGLRFAPGVEPWGDYQQVGNSYVTTMTANVRSRPGLDGKIVAQLPAGTRLWVAAAAGGTPWYLVSDKGVAQGYVSNALVKLAGAAPGSCKMVTQTVNLPDAPSQSESYQACPDSSGQWVLTRV
jgi:uncharacterized protein YgiM (DUF1202 family)